MLPFVIRPISRAITAAVRDTLRAPGYGHPAHRELARGTGPCRECLSEFAVKKDDRLLFTYNAFEGSGSVAQPGPVFIHAEPCEPFAGDGYPAGLKALPILAEAHFEDGSRSALRTVAPGDEATILADLIRQPGVLFLNLRHAEAGCFIARVEHSA